jgi:hypothetical protein
MRIRFTRLTNDRHALEIRRDGGAAERVELETRSFLLHDLIHYAVESTAGLQSGVWGRLAAGTSLAELNDQSGDMAAGLGEGSSSRTSELMTIERVTGPLHAMAQGRASPEAALTAMTELFAAAEQPLPAWLTLDFVRRTSERLRQLLGRFRATPFGQAMELPWP